MKLRDLPSVDELLRDERLSASRTTSRSPRPGRSSIGRARTSGRDRSGPIAETRARGARTARAPVAAPRAQRDRRPRAHEPRPGAARRRRAGASRRGRKRLLEPRVRPRARGARLAPGSSRRPAGAPHGRRGGARRQQQRGCRAPRARCARGRSRGRRLARRADRDRRRLPHPGRPCALRRAPRRGRDDEPDARGRLRARDRPRDRRAPPRAPVELPRRRLLGAPASCAISPTSLGATTFRSSTISAPARSVRVGDEPTPAESLGAGADLVCFSGDKLLGGPQAGVVVGRADLVERLRRHPLQRALRADKLTLAALEGTLALGLVTESRVPVLRMLHEPVEAVRARAERLAELVGGEVEETVARVGGGALPLAELAERGLRGRGGARGAPPARRAPRRRARARRPNAPRLPHAHGRRRSTRSLRAVLALR